MAEKEKGRWFGLLAGPAITYFALCAIWKNETRFDFARAAQKTPVVEALDEAVNEQPISVTGPMDQKLTMPGDYVSKFTGYLFVRRNAEIFAWDRDKDSDGNVTWRKRWMSSVDNNSRNSGIRQTLSSKRFQPDEYQVGPLPVVSKDVEFIDATKAIQPETLSLERQDFMAREKYFFLSQTQNEIGAERVSYSGIPVPATATYFGKFANGAGVADDSHRRVGWLNEIIQDSGVLHHVVAGNRDEAVASMKAYIGRLKWIVRGVAVAATVGGLMFFFSTIFGALYSLPLIGRIAEAGVFALSVAIGVPLALLTIAVSYLFANPLVLVGIIGAISLALFLTRRKGIKKQEEVKTQLKQHYGESFDTYELKELEFMELAQLAFKDDDFTDEEAAFLKEWAKKHGWSDEKYQRMLAQAMEENDVMGNVQSTDEHLLSVIKLAMADGNVTQFELKTIHEVARDLGYDKATIRALTDRVRSSAL